MILRPNNLSELQDALASANRRKEKVAGVELGALNRVLEHAPEDMTVSVECGITLAELQRQIAPRGQWLPIDPAGSGQPTVKEVLQENLSGPRRFGNGTIRDHLIGLKVALADGRVIKSGGKVVKNVAGYDMGKLFIGSRGTLGIAVEATFKLKPLPEKEAFVETSFDTLSEADSFLNRVLDSELTPVVLDLHNVNQPGSHTLVVGFAGVQEDVDYQQEIARELGAKSESSLDYDERFWSRSSAHSPTRLSVLPSELERHLTQLGSAEHVARAGNGLIWHRGSLASNRDGLPLELFTRVKDTYDPNHIFPDLFA